MTRMKNDASMSVCNIMSARPYVWSDWQYSCSDIQLTYHKVMDHCDSHGNTFLVYRYMMMSVCPSVTVSGRLANQLLFLREQYRRESLLDYVYIIFNVCVINVHVLYCISGSPNAYYIYI